MRNNDYIYTLFALSPRGGSNKNISRFEDLAGSLGPGSWWEFIAVSSNYSDLDEVARENQADYYDCTYSYSVVRRNRLNDSFCELTEQLDQGTLYEYNGETYRYDEVVSNIDPEALNDRKFGRVFILHYIEEIATEQDLDVWFTIAGLFDSLEEAKKYMIKNNKNGDTVYNYGAIREVPTECVYPGVFDISLWLYEIKDSVLTEVNISDDTDKDSRTGKIIDFVRGSYRFSDGIPEK